MRPWTRRVLDRMSQRCRRRIRPGVIRDTSRSAIATHHSRLDCWTAVRWSRHGHRPSRSASFLDRHRSRAAGEMGHGSIKARAQTRRQIVNLLGIGAAPEYWSW